MDMNVELISCTPGAGELCGKAAAVCTASDRPEKSLEHALASGHTSVLEHATFTFKIEGLSRAALAQLTRHRLASFDVQSQRYVRIHGIDLVMPESIKNSDFYTEAGSLLEDVMNLYQRMVDAGINCEDARYVTPQAVPTTLVVTMNARELCHFFALRTCNRAQWEIREAADRMLAICRREAPVLFADAGPGCVTGHCPEKKPCGHPRGKRSDFDGRKP